ncbi:MAG: hypothetical protein ACJA2X_000963 [Halocynthiibacter sp.]|jgi:hypothetical protein
MTRIVKRYLSIALTTVLAVGMISSSNSRVVSHDITELAKIVTEHHAEIADHGHAHEGIVSVMESYHWHADEVADHDLNIAILPPRTSSSMILPTRSGWTLANVCCRPRSNVRRLWIDGSKLLQGAP